MQNYIVSSLPFPDLVECHYIQRKNAKQFFSKDAIKVKEINLQNRYYSNSYCPLRWKILFDKFNLYKTTAKNHFDFFDNRHSLQQIIRICNKIYSL